VGELREQGGEVQVDALNLRAAQVLDVASIYIAPAEGKPTEAFDEACVAFARLDVAARTPEHAGEIAERAAAALGASA
jgi:hypothetical protein